MRSTSAYVAFAATSLVLACAPMPEATIVSLPPPPDPVVEDAPAVPRSDASFALESYYENIQTGLLIRGLLREDGGGPDTRFDHERLVATFNEVVFRQEFVRRGTRLVATGSETTLNKFDTPVALNVVYGETVSEEARAIDDNEIARLIRRLARQTMHPIAQSDTPGNFTVFILHEDDRLTLGPRLTEVMPELTPEDVAAILDMPRNRYCLVVTSDPANDGRLKRAFAIIRAEHPQKLRASCIHEEIAQGLGLQNDSPTARPSIFTDEEEFGRLTTMDELLLTMLYDDRLPPGISATDAAPIVDQIARELLAEDPPV